MSAPVALEPERRRRGRPAFPHVDGPVVTDADMAALAAELEAEQAAARAARDSARNSVAQLPAAEPLPPLVATPVERVLFSARDVAGYLGISRSAAFRLMHAPDAPLGELVRIGAAVRVRRRDVDRFIECGGTPAPEEGRMA